MNSPMSINEIHFVVKKKITNLLAQEDFTGEFYQVRKKEKKKISSMQSLPEYERRKTS